MVYICPTRKVVNEVSDEVFNKNGGVVGMCSDHAAKKDFRFSLPVPCLRHVHAAIIGGLQLLPVCLAAARIFFRTLGVLVYFSMATVAPIFSEKVFRFVGLFLRFDVFRRTAQAIKIVSVCLNHAPSFRKILSIVVALAEGKLVLYPVHRYTPARLGAWVPLLGSRERYVRRQRSQVDAAHIAGLPL